jgi:uncharacterized protein
MVPSRLEGLDERQLPCGTRAFTARSFRARLLGLAGISDLPPGLALLIPRCSCVHTFGMRFPLDITFLDAGGRPLGERRRVPPRRIVRHRGAAAVLERRSYAVPTSPPKR